MTVKILYNRRMDTLSLLLAIVLIFWFLSFLMLVITRAEANYRSYKEGNTFNNKKSNAQETYSFSGWGPSKDKFSNDNHQNHDTSWDDSFNQKYCPKCNKIASIRSSFCSKCGTSLHSARKKEEDSWNSVKRKKYKEEKIINFTKEIGGKSILELERMNKESIFKLVKSELQKITSLERKPLSGEVEYLKEIMKAIRKTHNN